jgi:uncharacterized repeat protein (TIGR03943 family)
MKVGSFVVALVGLYMAVIGGTNVHENVVKPSAGLWLIVAGSVMASAGVTSLVRGITPHRHGSVRLWWLCVVLVAFPVVVAAIIPPAPLTLSDGLNTPNGGSDQRLVSLGELSDGIQSATWEGLLNRALYHDAAGLREAPLRLVGRVEDLDGELVITRFVMNCCVADAYPVVVVPRQGSVALPPAGTWISLTGTFEGVVDRDGPAITMSLESVLVVDEPESPYEIAQRT